MTMEALLFVLIVIVAYCVGHALAVMIEGRR